jgi:hypothetical protein
MWFGMGVQLGLLILREEHRLRVLRIYGLKRDEVRALCYKLDGRRFKSR